MCYRVFRRKRAFYRSITAIVVFSAACLFLSPGDAVKATGQEPPKLSIEQVDVGIGGYYKVGKWTPIAVQIKVDRPCRVRWSVEAPDPHGNRATLPGGEQDLTDAGVHSLTGYFKTGRLQSRLLCRLEWSNPSDEDPVWQAADERTLRAADGPDSPLRSALKQSVVLVATLGQPAGFENLPELSKPLQVVPLEEASQLPGGYPAYDGLDVLAINGSHQLSREQSHAIRDWVRGGGHLVLAVGGDDVPAFRAGELSEWMGDLIPLAGTRQLRELSGFDRLAIGEKPIVIRRGSPVPAARIRFASPGDRKEEAVQPAARFDGVVLVSEQREPVVLRLSYAFGRITFFAVDLSRPPLADWKPLPDVIQTLVFDDFTASSDGRRNQRRRLARTGISDLATQLQFSLEDFPGVHRVSSWTVMTLMLLYLAVIGPADYFLVRRLFPGPWYTWLTFPLIVALCAALAAWTAASTNGGELRLNQIDVIDIDATSKPGEPQFVRTRTWMTVYSPQTERNRVSIVPQEIGHIAEIQPESTATLVPKKTDLSPGRIRLSWSGIPEESFGGMYRSGGIDFGRPGYRFKADGTGIDDLPIPIWSTAPLTSAGMSEVDRIVESDLTSRGYGLLAGTLVHHFSDNLRDWMLAYGPGVYYPKIDPQTGEPAVILRGERWSPDDPDNVRQQTLEGFIKRIRLTRVKKRNSSGRIEHQSEETAYDPLARQPIDILRMITFYRRAGGKGYTQLDNDTLRNFDLSFLVELDRAVLFARIDSPAAELKFNGRPPDATRRWTIVRIVLPVRKTR